MRTHVHVRRTGRTGRTARWATLAVAATLLTACTPPPGAGTVPPALLTAAETPAATPTASAEPTTEPSTEPTTADPTAPATDLVRPDLVRWGGHGKHLALVVRNTTGATIRRALVRIEVRDRAGRVLVDTVGRPGSKCCTVLGVTPDGEFGLFATLPTRVRDVGEVSVRYAELELADRAPKGWVAIDRAELRRTPNDAIVTARFTASGKVGPYIAGQAFLVDRRNRLVGVISGRFFCYASGTKRRVRMELTRPVPRGTRVERAVAHPIPRGIPANVDHRCR